MRQFFLTSLVFLICCLFWTGCKKEDNTNPKTTTFPLDTVNSDQYIYCWIDTIQFWAYTKGTGPDKIRMSENSDEVTRFQFETVLNRTMGVPLVRNLELNLFRFKEQGLGLYAGAKLFAKSRMDVMINRVEADDLYFEYHNVVTNRLDVTSLDSNFCKGSFSFKLRSIKNPSSFIEVRNGKFRVRIR